MKKIYKMAIKERISFLKQMGLPEKALENIKYKTALSNDQIDHSIENGIGQIEIPLGLATDFLINGREYLVPMATEEPSVVAAASNGAMRIKKSGGFISNIENEYIIGQIIFDKLQNSDLFAKKLNSSKKILFELAEKVNPRAVKRGDGLKKIIFHQNTKNDWIELRIASQQSMGANLIDSIAEKIKNWIENNLLTKNDDVLAAILSNSSKKKIVHLSGKVSFDDLKTRQMTGEKVAKKIAALSGFAKINNERRATDFKGILNGIEAVCLATANDTRAVAASLLESYQKPDSKLVEWFLGTDNFLHFKADIPMPVGVIGGAINYLPYSKYSLELLGKPKAEELMSITACVGVANNLAATRALVTEGIQAGHMPLQNKRKEMQK